MTAGSPSSVELTIRDDDKPNRPPTVSASCHPCVVPPGGASRLTATASDPDGDRLTYRWSALRGRMDGAADGAAADWTAPGETARVMVRVEVSDGRGGSASAGVMVEVENRPPAFEQDVHHFELAEHVDGRRQAVVLGKVTASDPDGDSPTYVLASGDRSCFAVGAGDGVVTYIGPGEDFEAGPKRYALTVGARDPHGAEAQVRVVVAVVDENELPAAEDDEAETREDRPVVVDVLANDRDPNGGGLRVETVSTPAHGTARVASGGGVIYAPAANFHGADRFTYVASDSAGSTTTAAVAVTVRPVDDAPLAVRAIPDQALDSDQALVEGGGPWKVDLTRYFADADGDVLTYRAGSSRVDVVAATVTGAVLTLTPVMSGTAAVTVTAEDASGLTAAQTFTVGVDDRLVGGVLGNTLAAMARSHLASVRMTLGRRVTAGPEGSRLTVMGRPVPLGKAAARQAAEQMLAGWLPSVAWPGATAHGHPPYGTPGASPALGAHPGGGLGGPAHGSLLSGPAGGLSGFAGFGGGPDALLRGTAFELGLGGDGDGGTPSGRRWGVWGQGDIQTFRGAPTPLEYDGDVRTGYVGVDARLAERWLAGVAVARSAGAGDWQVGASGGRLRAALTALHPYVQWSDGATSVWTMAGGGWGTAENARKAAVPAETSDLGLRLGLVELRRRLGAAPGGAEFGLRADAAWTELRTADGGESVDLLAAAVDQQRVGAEVSRPVRLGGLALQPFGEAHLRRDGGAGQAGTGVEVAVGLRARSGIVRIDAQGRALAVHSAAGYRERGAGVTLTVGGAGREGLSLSVSPRWGDGAAGAGGLWQDEVYRQVLPAAGREQWALDARAAYGVRLPSGGLLSWFCSYGHSAHDHHLLVGGRLGGLVHALLHGG